jgi:hypothetical protein
MVRVAVAAVVAPAVSMVVFAVLMFAGILFTTQGKQSAPSDHLVLFGSWGVATFLGGWLFAVIAGQFDRAQAWSLIALYALLYLLFPASTAATGTYGMSILIQIPIALAITTCSVLAGGWLRPRRKAT